MAELWFHQCRMACILRSSPWDRADPSSSRAMQGVHVGHCGGGSSGLPALKNLSAVPVLPGKCPVLAVRGISLLAPTSCGRLVTSPWLCWSGLMTSIRCHCLQRSGPKPRKSAPALASDGIIVTGGQLIQSSHGCCYTLTLLGFPVCQRAVPPLPWTAWTKVGCLRDCTPSSRRKSQTPR